MPFSCYRYDQTVRLRFEMMTVFPRAARPLVLWRPQTVASSRCMSIFDSKWKKKQDRKKTIKYKGRVRELHPDHDKDQLSEKKDHPKDSKAGLRLGASFLVFDYSSDNPMQRVYTWGMACYGALGVPEYLRPRARHAEPYKTMHR